MSAGFTGSRETVLKGLDYFGSRACAYGTWPDGRCDCKYGVGDGGSEQTGCPELRTLRHLALTLTDDEWTMLERRAGGIPSGYLARQTYSRESALNAEVAQLRAECRNFATLVDRGMRGIGADTDDGTIYEFVDRYSAGETPVVCPECDVMPPGATSDCKECARIVAEDRA